MKNEIIQNVVLEPINECRKTVDEIQRVVLKDHRKITNAVYDPQISEKMRELASNLLVNTEKVSWFFILFRFKFLRIPSKKCAIKSCHCLNLIAANMESQSKQNSAQKNCEALIELENLLGIRTRY
jgi:hypothetical protein